MYPLVRHFISRTLWIVTLASVVSAASIAQDAPGGNASVGNGPEETANVPVEMTLGAAVGLALRNNRSIKNAQIAREAANFAVKVQEDAFTPQLTISSDAALTRTRQKTYSTDNQEIASLANQLKYAASLSPTLTLKTGLGTSYSLKWNNVYARTVDRGAGSSGPHQYTVDPVVSIEQPLLKGFGEGITTANLEISRLNTRLDFLNMKNTVSQTVTSVITAYWQVFLDKERLSIAEISLARARQILDINQALVQSGRMAELDMIQTQTDVARKELSLEVAQNTYRQSKATLLALLDLPRYIDFTPSDIGEVVKTDFALPQALDCGMLNRFEIFRAKISLSLAKISLKVAKDGKRWDLRLIGSAQSNNTRQSYNDAFKGVPTDSHTYSIGFSLVVPLSDMAAEQEVVQARGGLQTAQNNYAEAEQVVRLDIQNATRNVNATYRQYELAQRAQALARQQLQIERNKLSLGRSSNFQVLTYQDTLRTAQLDEVSARVDYLMSLANLDLALGTTTQTWAIEVKDDSIALFGATNSGVKNLAFPPSL